MLVSTVFIQINVLKSLIDSIANATIYTNFFLLPLVMHNSKMFKQHASNQGRISQNAHQIKTTENFQLHVRTFLK